MPSLRKFSRIDTVELKAQILKRLGPQKAEKYFYQLKRFLSVKLNKTEFNNICYRTIGKENVPLHNLFIRSIIRNAGLSHSPPSKVTNMSNSRNPSVSERYFGGTFLTSPQKGWQIDKCDHTLTHCGKVDTGSAIHQISIPCDMQRPQELMSIGSKALHEIGSVEDGEEVEQVRGSPGIQSKSPVTAPLGISMNLCGVSRRHFRTGSKSGFYLQLSDIVDTCYNCSELPDTRTLRKRLEHKLCVDGLGLSTECANLLNSGLDVFLKRLVKPCMELARARSNGESMSPVNRRSAPFMNGALPREHVQRSNQSYSASLMDFRVAMELNPQLLGHDWPIHFEKIYLHALE